MGKFYHMDFKVGEQILLFSPMFPHFFVPGYLLRPSGLISSAAATIINKPDQCTILPGARARFVSDDWNLCFVATACVSVSEVVELEGDRAVVRALAVPRRLFVQRQNAHKDNLLSRMYADPYRISALADVAAWRPKGAPFP